MRLLEHKNGEFSLTEDFCNETRFAILSHTWGAEEVTFRDLIDGTGKARLGIARSSFAENKQDATACNIFGWTPVVSTNRIAPSSKRLLTLCFTGIAMQLNAMYICQTFRNLLAMLMTSLTNRIGNRHFGKADGSLEAGPFKSLLRRLQLNFLRKGKLLGNKAS